MQFLDMLKLLLMKVLERLLANTPKISVYEHTAESLFANGTAPFFKQSHNMAVRTERSKVRRKNTKGQYSPVRLKLARLVSSLLHGFLIIFCFVFASQ